MTKTFSGEKSQTFITNITFYISLHRSASDSLTSTGLYGELTICPMLQQVTQLRGMWAGGGGVFKL